MEALKKIRMFNLLQKGLNVDELAELTALIIEERNEFYEPKVKNNGDLAVVSNWVAVKDRLPDIAMRYLVVHESGDKGICSACVDNKWRENDIVVNSVTHWQPLPKPPYY